jgi:hypothetical protein
MQHESLPSTGRTFLDFATCASAALTTYRESILSAGASRARTLVEPGGAPDLQASDQDSGLSTIESFVSYDRDTSSWKTRQLCLSLFVSAAESLPLPQSAEYLETWPRSGMTRNGRLYPHAPWVRHTHGKECSLWPTPIVNDGENYSRSRAYFERRSRVWSRSLASEVALATGGKTPMGFYGRLNPRWIEWLMGFPPDWANLED